jgi:hypothetical protein
MPASSAKSNHERKLITDSHIRIKSAISAQVQSLVITLTGTQLEEYMVTMPVSGVRVSPPLLVAKAGRCWIYDIANHQESKWLAMVAKSKKISHVLKFTPPGGSRYWIKTIVNAAEDDAEKREESALKYVHESLALLMTYSILEKNAMMLLPKQPIIEIGPSRHASRHAYVFGTENPFWAGETIASSALPELLINDEALKKFRQFEFDRVSAVLAQQSVTEIEKAIRDSINVLYYGFSSSDLVWRYIALVTALERLLTMPGEGSIRRNLAERLAWVLGESESPKYRGDVKERVEAIYGRRSDFIHQTVKIETLSADILTLHSYILALIGKLSTGQFKTITSLKQWAANKMLGF